MLYNIAFYGYYIVINLAIFALVVYLSKNDKSFFEAGTVLSLGTRKGKAIYLSVLLLDAAVAFVFYGSEVLSMPIDTVFNHYGGIVLFTLLPTLPGLLFIIVSRYFSNLALLPLFLLTPIGFLYPFVTIMGGSISIFALYCLFLVLTLVFYIVLAHKRGTLFEA